MKTNTRNRTRWLVIIAVCLCTLLVGIAPASAQATPISMGGNITGEVTAAAPIAEYTIAVPSAQGARVQVLAITPGLAPFFSVIDSTSGIPVLDAGVEGTTTTVQGNLTLAAGIPYRIRVESANGVFGQFLVSVQPADVAPSGTLLTPGTLISDSVGTASPTKQYGFPADPIQTLLLTVDSQNPAAGPVVRFRDADSGQTLASISTRLSGVRLSIPPGAQNYVVEVGHGGSPTDEAYMVCLETESGTIRCPGSGPAATPEVSQPTETPLPTQPNFVEIPIPANGPCSVAPVGGSPVNVRGGPSTSFPIVTQLAPNSIVPVVGRTADNSWYQVDVSAIIGWVSATVVRIGGNNCGGLTVIGAPTPTAAPPTFTATTGATATPGPTLDHNLTPMIGILPALTFVLDLVELPGIPAGGSVNASYLGGDCFGYTTSAPTLGVNVMYTAGAAYARFYFISSADTTMIIRTPGGSYVCADDSYGTLHPLIDARAAEGTYHVWIGSFRPDTPLSGTLYVTENLDNHP